MITRGRGGCVAVDLGRTVASTGVVAGTGVVAVSVAVSVAIADKFRGSPARMNCNRRRYRGSSRAMSSSPNIPSTAIQVPW